MKFLVYIFIFCNAVLVAQTKPVKKTQIVKKNKQVVQKQDTILGVTEMKVQESEMITEDVQAPSVEQILPNEVFTIVEEMPEYPGGNEILQKDLTLAMKHTEQTKLVSGKCFAKFTVDKTGAIIDPVILKGISGCSQCDAVALDAIKQLKKFKPGKQNGRVMNVAYTIPIKFN